MRCILCSAELIVVAAQPGFWLHPESEACSVWITDNDGLSIDEDYEVGEDGTIYERGAAAEQVPDVISPDTGPGAELGETLLERQLALMAGAVDPLTYGRIDRANPSFVIDIEALAENPFTSSEYALTEIFAEAGLPRLGGASGSRGWSSISTFQKCKYLWKRRYMDTVRGILDRKPKMPALEIGTLIHAFLAIGYMGKIDPSYPLTQTQVRDALLHKLVNPAEVDEAWRVVSGYWAYYRSDGWIPLAVEHLVVDPKTGESCRIDLVFKLDEPQPGFQPGTYTCDFKSAARFDKATLDGWPNDGEIIGIVDLYERTKMHKRFGPLQGIVVDILGKQKELQFERKLVRPSRALVKDHRKSLRIWGAAIDTAVALESFPRSRASCVQRYGYLCDEFDHCTLMED